MQSRLLNRFFLVGALGLTLLVSSCSSSNKIDVKDKSTISTSRKDFFASLYKSIEDKHNSVNSYFSRKIQIAADGIPVYSSVNAQIFIKGNELVIGKVYLPFPVVEVAKFKIGDGLFLLESKAADKNIANRLPKSVVPILKSAFIGAVPEVYALFGDHDYSKFQLYIENDKYILVRRNTLYSVEMTVNSDFSLNSIDASYQGQKLNMKCSNYSSEGGVSIPHTINLSTTVEKREIEAKLTVKSVSLNSANKLDY